MSSDLRVSTLEPRCPAVPATVENMAETTETGLATAEQVDSPSATKRSKFQIYGNLIVLSTSFLIYFIGISPLTTIQISLNIDPKLRSTALGVHTAAMLLQALFFNCMFIKRLDNKRAILAGISLEIIFVGANMHTRWWTLIPASFLAGLGRPLLRTAALVYLANLADIYIQKFQKKNPNGIKWKFFSIYFIVCSCASVVGTMVLSILFLDMGFDKFSLSQLRHGGIGAEPEVNISDQFQFCGTDFCDRNLNSTLLIIDALHDYEAIHYRHTHELCGFSMGSLLFSSIIVLLFLQPLKKVTKIVQNKDEPEEVDLGARPWHHLLDPIRNWRNPLQALIVPMLLYSGMNNSFFVKDFAKSFVTCVFGLQITGFAIAWFSFSALLSIFIFSLLLSNCRPIPLVIAFGAHFAGAISLFTLTNSNYNLKKMFLVTITWGIGSGLWPFCTAVFTGIVFPKSTEAAFSNYSFFHTLGATLNFAWNYHLCTGQKLHILITLLIIGFTGYLMAEFLHKRQTKNR